MTVTAAMSMAVLTAALVTTPSIDLGVETGADAGSNERVGPSPGSHGIDVALVIATDASVDGSVDVYEG
jgi:hypothetical protein